MIAFTDPYLVVQMVFHRRGGSGRLEDCGGFEQAGNQGRFRTRLDARADRPVRDPQGDDRAVQRPSDTNDAMTTGRIDVIALDNLGTSGLMSQFPGKFKVLPGLVLARGHCDRHARRGF